MFVQSMRGNIPMDDVVTQVREAVDTMHQRKMEAYRKGIDEAFKKPIAAASDVTFDVSHGTSVKGLRELTPARARPSTKNSPGEDVPALTEVDGVWLSESGENSLQYAGNKGEIIEVQIRAKPSEVAVLNFTDDQSVREALRSKPKVLRMIDRDEVLVLDKSAMKLKRRLTSEGDVLETFTDKGGRGPINFEKVAATAREGMGTGQFKGVTYDKSTAPVRQAINQRIKEWGKLDPAEYHTVEGMDALRKSIGDVLDSTPFNTPERRIANKAYFSVRKAIEAQAPGYGESYVGAITRRRTICVILRRPCPLGKTAATETALRKLQAVMRNDVTSIAYGQRARYAKELKGAGANLLDEALAGQAMNPWMPRSFGSRVAGLGSGVATAAGAINPAALPLVGAASPRMVGGAALRAGQGGRSLAEILARVPRGTGQAAFQGGRASGVAP